MFQIKDSFGLFRHASAPSVDLSQGLPKVRLSQHFPQGNMHHQDTEQLFRNQKMTHRRGLGDENIVLRS